MKSRLIVYHGNCRDGFFAAWAARKRFGDDDTEYVPAFHGSPLIQCAAGRDVFFLDFCYPRETMVAIHRVAKSLTVLDHHKTAAEDMAGLPFATFDMNRSGAGMAWDIFHSTADRPWVINYVEDRDLWKFQLPESKQINAWIGAYRLDDFHQADDLSDDGFEAAVSSGSAVLTYIDSYISEMVQNARSVTFHSHAIPLVNAPPGFISELVGKLAETAPFAIGWFQRGDGNFIYSLRSRGAGGVDVSEIAKLHGGGGHRNAAGFQSKTMVEFK